MNTLTDGNDKIGFDECIATLDDYNKKEHCDKEMPTFNDMLRLGSDAKKGNVMGVMNHGKKINF